MSFWEAVRARSLTATWTANQTAILNLVQTIGIIGTLMFAIWSYHAESNGRSADFMLRFDDLLDSGKSGLVETQIDEEENLNKISLQGDALDEAIGDYLSNYELLAVAYRNHLISEDMSYDAFSWSLEKALNDPAIRRYLSESKAEESDLFDGVLELAETWNLKFAPIVPSKIPAAKGAH